MGSAEAVEGFAGVSAKSARDDMNNYETFVRQVGVPFECVFPAVVLRVVFSRIDLYRHHRRLDQAVRLCQERSAGQEQPGIP